MSEKLTATLQFAGLAGMLLAFAFSVFGVTQFGVRQCAEVENQMTSVERVITYTKLPAEPGYDRPKSTPKDWPDNGSLSIRNMSLKYSDDGPLVLKNVTIDVEGNQKVGIVGRTGAGKSSLVAALFRMPDPIGKVFIDDVDLGTIDIQSARRAMAVITQDPVLVAGKLRTNLDPLNMFSDQEIWTALEEVQLKNKMVAIPNQLDHQLSENGSSFSVGERQLLCLARALLQKCKVLVLDEATANVDFTTDQLIQKVLRNKFSSCTVLTIAHRLNTIMDYDKAIVMEGGRVEEYDKPQVLANREGGAFYRLAGNMQLNKTLD
jgi:ABC-type multidrug transport system fused ATPase/permease subunit